MRHRLALVWLASLGAAGATARAGAQATPNPVSKIEVELDLRQPPALSGVATLHGRGGDAVEFLLNGSLAVDRVTGGDGSEAAFRRGGKLRSTYHSEARVWCVDRPAGDGEWSLRIDYSGRGMDGSEGKDWMGILLLAADELRMSVQTAFYPQVEPELDGPGVAALVSRLVVRLPAAFEAHAPGKLVACGEAAGGGREWQFESDVPTVLSLFAASRVRRETALGDARVVTLLSDEHAHLGEAFAREAKAILDAYAEQWGPIGARTLGVCEIHCRGKSSYNWAAQGIIAIDRGALRSTLPVEQLAHEIAHLWWGQEVVATGRGERFLTESVAEYAAWRHTKAGADRIDTARAEWLQAVHTSGRDPALADVVFATPGYQALAYSKGPLALWALEARVGRAAVDATLRAYRAHGRRGTLDDFLAALREHAGPPAQVVPWLESPGHAHLEIAAAGPEVRAVPCPRGCPTLLPPALTMRVHLQGRHEDVTIDGSRLPATPKLTAAPLALVLDPSGVALGEPAAAVYLGRARLESTVPADGAGDVALGPLVVELRFAAPLSTLPGDVVARVQQASVAAARRAKTIAVTIASVELAEAGRALRVRVHDTLPSLTHSLAIPMGLLDADGVPMPAQAIDFTLRASDPASRPRIAESDPANGAVDVATDLRAIRITFSEPMRRGRGFPGSRIAELAGQGWAFPALGAAKWSADGRTLVWELAQPLAAGKGYALPFGGRFRDADGNELEPLELRFRTRAP